MEQLFKDLREKFGPEGGDYCAAILTNNALVIIESTRIYIYNEHTVTEIWIKRHSQSIKMETHRREHHLMGSPDVGFIRKTLELALLADTIEVVKIASSHRINFQKLIDDQN